MDWKKGILTLTIAATLAVCPFSYAFAEYNDSDRSLLVEIENALVAIIPGRLDLIRADLTDSLTYLQNISNNTFNPRGYSLEDHGWTDGSGTYTTGSLGYWLKTINSTIENAQRPIEWNSYSLKPSGSYVSNSLGDFLNTMNGTLSTMNGKIQDLRSYSLEQHGWTDGSGSYAGGSLGWLLNRIYTKIPSSSSTNWRTYSLEQNGWTDGSGSYSGASLGWFLNSIKTTLTKLSNNNQNLRTYSLEQHGWTDGSGSYAGGSLGWLLNRIYTKIPSGGGSSVWTTNDVTELINNTQAIASSVSDLASGMDGGGLYYLNVIADELHKTDPGYLKEWLIDIYNAIGTQTTQLQEAIEGISSGGGSGGEAADLSTIEGLLQKLTYYSDGATGYILKVHDLGVFDQLTDVNTELIGIRTLLGQFFAADTASDVIGEVDFSEIADKSNATLDTISTLAPFGSILLYSECVAILSTTPAVQEPKLVFDFNFCPGVNEHVILDLSWLDPMHDAINFACMLMLVMGLASITMRYVELEAAS